MNEEKLPSLIHTCWTSAYTPKILPCVQRNTFDTSHFEKLRDILGQCFDCVDSVFSRCKHWVQRALAVCCRLRMKLLKLLWINLSSGNSRSYSCIEKIHWPFSVWASFKCPQKWSQTAHKNRKFLLTLSCLKDTMTKLDLYWSSDSQR